MFNIFGRVKDLILAGFAIALPILYIIGRTQGKAAEKNKILKDELKTKEKVSKFYKKMAEHEDDPSTNDKRNFSKRLRDKGL